MNKLLISLLLAVASVSAFAQSNAGNGTSGSGGKGNAGGPGQGYGGGDIPYMFPGWQTASPAKREAYEREYAKANGFDKIVSKPAAPMEWPKWVRVNQESDSTVSLR